MLISISLCTDMMSPAIHVGIDLKSAKIKRSLCIAFIDSWIKPPKNNSELNFLSLELRLILDKLSPNRTKACLFLISRNHSKFLQETVWDSVHFHSAQADLYHRVCHYSAFYSISVYRLSNVQFKLSWLHWKISQAFDKPVPVGISV